ncbi:MAG TPA: 50S ribosomal protein L4 [Caldithrix abyssi]|uniref:Large ribosomal subunit protein uL4 n=1 Tax=Caldithrix abyssi TaxID=187145 RepID=A0A7V4TYA9_CALAY|nr:50S ribosomal protein L4 [Caldithrix abyssi]
MKLNVFEQNGKKTTAQAELSDKVFAIEPNDHVIWLDIKALRAARRQGTHQTKGRSFVSGGGKKPFRQKGTGRARQGTIRAPHHVGGGRVFGPEPRNYRMKVNKKVRLLARKSALTYKAKDNKIVVVKDFDYENPSTKAVKNMLEALKLDGKRVLICTNGTLRNVVKSAANIYGVEVRDSVTFSTYDILKADTLIMQEGALKKVNEVLGR